MHDEPRQRLCELLVQYGRSLCDDPRRCEALLKDYCGQYKREIFVLVNALKSRVAADLINVSAGLPLALVMGRLIQRLEDELGLAEDAARWAVESWALALEPSASPSSPLQSFTVFRDRFWPLYPQFLRDLFTRAFTDGLRDPHQRVRESEWRAALVQLRDAILYCGQCGAENFYDGETLRASGGQPGSCWSCKRPLMLPFRLRIGRGVVMLNHDTQLFPHHLDSQRLYDLSQPLAAVQRHP